MPRKVKRSAWARQPAAERRAIWARNAKQLLSPGSRKIFSITPEQFSKLPEAQKNAIIVAHVEHLRELVKGMKGSSPTDYLNRIKKNIADISPEDKIHFFKAILSSAEKKEGANYYSRLEKAAVSHLRERGMVSGKNDQETAVGAFRRFIRERGVHFIHESFDWRGFERSYLSQRKADRLVHLMDAEDTSALARKVFPKMRLTPNQKKVVRRWVRAHFYEDYWVPRHEIQKLDIKFDPERVREWRESMMQSIQKMDEVEEHFFEAARKELGGSFIQSKPTANSAANTRRESKPAQPAKMGTREGRIAAYVAAPEELGIVEKRELKKREHDAKVSGMPFDPVGYVLEEIHRESEILGRLMENYVQRKLLDRGTIVSLFSSGSLSRRTFLDVLRNTDFVARFGESRINALAKGLAYIGPRGRIISKSEHFFNMNHGQGIFAYLEKGGFLETQHTGRNVVYLRRAGT